MPNQSKDNLFSGNWLDVIKEQNHEYMVRKICTGIAIIIAVNDKGQIILTEQYRVAAHSRVLELPAGMAGDEQSKEQETVIEAAKRELLEETGYEAATLKQVAEGPISSGISSEVMTFFYTDNIIKRGKGGGVGSEDITVHAAPLDKAEKYLHKAANENNLLIDPKLYIGLYFAHKLYRQDKEPEQLLADMVSPELY